jgi:hypothetical protein
MLLSVQKAESVSSFCKRWVNVAVSVERIGASRAPLHIQIGTRLSMQYSRFKQRTDYTTIGGRASSR